MHRHPFVLARLAALAAGLALGSLCAQDAAGPPLPPPPPPPKTRLVYDLPAYDVSKLLAARPTATIDSILGEVLACLRLRLGDRAAVTALGGTAFAVDVDGDAAAAALLRPTIEGKAFEMRMVAAADFAMDGVEFDLAEERARLQRWLDAGGKERVLADPAEIARFNDDPKDGPLAAPHLRWMPHRIEPRVDDKTRWDLSYHALMTDTPLAASTVGVFDIAEDYRGGQVPAALQNTPHPFLVEFVAINWKELSFDGNHLDPACIEVAVAQDGNPAVRYRMRPECAALYGDWTQKHQREFCAILVFGQVRSAPYFVSRIPGMGQITGNYSQAEVEALAAALRQGDLPVSPVRIRAQALPAGAPK